MYINSSKAIQDFCKFVIKLYVGGDFLKIKTRIMLPRKNKLMLNISDMVFLNEYYKLNSLKIGEMTKIVDGATYDSAIGSNQNGFEMDSGIKKLVFINGRPYGFLKGKKIRFKCLHFAGPAKFYMKYLLKGENNLFSKFMVRYLMIIREKLSPMLNKKQVKFVKGLMLKLGF